MHLGPVAAQAGQRAGIALAFRGFQLRLVIVAEPEFGLEVGRLAQRRRGRDLLDRPACPLQPLAGIGYRGPYFSHGIEAIRIEAERDALRHRRTFQRRRHPPGIAIVPFADIAASEISMSPMVRARGPDTALIWGPIGRSGNAGLKAGMRPIVGRRPCTPQA